ncbi:MAG: hypothetical protein KDC95_03790 [Planctomycetes bacterium]|nr:hypothetical protein [Planctomycetota bacterium]
MLRLSLFAFALASSATSQFVYDFNKLSGNDQHPYTALDKQDGWSEQTFKASNRCGVTATLSHDGTQSLRFQEVGPGYGCDASRINDANWSYAKFAGSENSAYFQADMLVGYWGGTFGLAHDANADGTIRGSQAGELGVRFSIGSQANVQLRLIDAAGQVTKVPLTNAGAVKGGDWLRVRVVMDFTAASGAGLGWVDVENLSAKTANVAVPGLQGIPLALDQTSLDAKNPKSWDAVWLHFEGATYGLDNIHVGSDSARAIEFGKGCGSPALGLRGGARPVLATTASAVTHSLPSTSQIAVLMLGFSRFPQGIDLTAAGAPSCFLNINPSLSIAFAVTGSTATHALPIPSSPSLAKFSLHLQTLAIDSSANALGVLLSNGLTWAIDVR